MFACAKNIVSISLIYGISQVWKLCQFYKVLFVYQITNNAEKARQQKAAENFLSWKAALFCGHSAKKHPLSWG
jgi:hypothetical protein